MTSSVPPTSPPPRVVDPILLDLITGRVAQWVEQLMDLTRRNNLLFFRETKTQHLDLSTANPLERDRLLTGETVSIQDLFTVPGQSSDGVTDAMRRIKSIVAKTKENYEERSLDTLFVGIGECSWDFGGIRSTVRENTGGESRPPRAPLLLASMEVKSGKRKGDYDLTIAGDPEVNPALAYVMKRDHGIILEVPQIDNEDKEQNALDLLNSLRLEIEKAPGGVVTTGAQISNFSYAKLAMVQDLEADLAGMTFHQIILALSDDQQALQAVRGNLADPPMDRPNHIPPASEFLVLDADASQNMVINAILDGQTFAFDGPPGTGKSQTIANAIASLVANGKTVLFVAEKRAAIEAVMRRLENVGLSDLVMDYHGTSKKKKDVIENLRQANNALKAHSGNSDTSMMDELQRQRDQLVERAEKLHEKREPWGLSLYDILVIRSKNEHGAGTTFRFPSISVDKTIAAEVNRLENDLRQLWNLGGFIDTPGATMWRQASLSRPEEALEYIDALSDAANWQLDEIRVAFEQLIQALKAPKDDLGSTRLLALLAREVKEFQQQWGNNLFTPETRSLADALRPARNPFTRLAGLLFNRSYREARKALVNISGKKAKAKTALRVAIKANEIYKKWTEIHEIGLPVPDLSTSTVVDIASAAETQLAAISESLTAFKVVVDALGTKTEHAQQLIDQLLDDRSVAATAYEAGKLEEQLVNAGLERLIVEARTTTADIETLVGRLWFSWSQSLTERIGAQVPGFNAHSSAAFNQIAERFQTLDRRHIDITPDRIKANWKRNAIETALRHPIEESKLMDALNRQRKIPPLAQIFKNSKHCISSWKPCWVMSPLSVSMLRPPSQWFDVVIFDEASQILPADAITAIKAAKQVVVAGDDRQLPPTPFFASGQPDVDDGTETSTDVDNDIEVGNYESILAVMKTIVTKPRQLQWHYRSRDEKLIAFSNKRIYKSLITFPDSSQESCIQHVLAGKGPDAVSKGATNRSEVNTVVELVKEHVRLRPEESLGVIALGSPHANAIDDAMFRAREDSVELDKFMSEKDFEPFFVKNLERVQGDERDAIILSVGYGWSEDNKMRYNFGPINGKNGERRLNVATTRAKQRLTLVSTFTEMDLDESRCKDGGMSFLRDYVRYARTRGEDFGDTLKEAPTINAFEESISRHLTAAGLSLVPQYGVGKYAIDFAVVHPHDSTKFALAIECDGASYHSQPLARERDRLRQEVLEARGWKFHRIWSTDWFTNPEFEIKKCLLAFEEAIK